MIFADFFLAVLGFGLGFLVVAALAFLATVAVIAWLERGDDK